MKTKFYKLTLSVFIMAMTLSVFGQYEVLYLAPDDSSECDAALMEYLYLEGYNVTHVGASEFGAAPYDTPEAYEDYDVFYVSEVIGSSSANNFKAAGFPIPAVVTEGYAVKPGRWDILADDGEDYFLQASGSFLTADVLTLVVDDNENWITMDFDEGDEIVWSTHAEPTTLGVTGFNIDEDIPDAIPLGYFLQAEMNDFPSLWAIPEGAECDMGGTVYELPNIVLFGVVAPDGVMNATDGFNNLIKRSIEWATDNYEIEAVNSTVNAGVVFGPNPTHGTVNMSLTVDNAQTIDVTVYDITGKAVMTAAPVVNTGDNNVTFDVSELPASHYLVKVVTDKEVLSGKVIKD